MTQQVLGGQSGIWIPDRRAELGAAWAANDMTVANDLEEVQMVGRIRLDGRATGKTFSSGGGTLSWLPGASTVFNATSSLRVGVKQASSISGASGPPPRATAGSGAFDVYKDLVGGTDTISSTTARTDAMASGTLSVSDGDMIAVCFFLSKSSGTSSVKVRTTSSTGGFPTNVLVTASGATFTANAGVPNAVLTMDDGTVGYFYGSWVFAGAPGLQSSIGNGNIMGNKFRLNAPMKVCGMTALFNMASNADCDFGIYTDANPPVAVVSQAFDANWQYAANVQRYAQQPLASTLLAAGTDYIMGIKQTSANAVTVYGYTVDNTAHWRAHSIGPNCFAVSNTGGGAFSAINSSKTRCEIYAEFDSFGDDAGGSVIAGTPMLRGMV